VNSKEKKAADERLKQIYKTYYSSIYKFCLARIKDDKQAVEDITQETFIVLYNKLLGGEAVEKPHAFLFKVADNLIRRHYEKVKKDNVLISIEEVIELPTDKTDLDERLAFEQYSKEFSAALNDTDAELFSLRYIEELRINEIADITGMSIHNITIRLHRLKDKLRNLYGDEFKYR